MRTLVAALIVLGAMLARVACAQHGAADAVAAAEDVSAAEAKRLFHEGVDLLATESWSDAEARFRRSVQLTPRASSLYNWALALFELERYSECIEVTDRLLTIADPVEQAEYREHATTLRERARGVAPAPVAEPPAAVRAEEVPSAPQHTAVERAPIAATSAKTDRAEQSGSSTAWLVIGGGVLVLGGGLVTGLLASSADDDFTQRCPDARDCDASLRSLGERTKRLAIATDILLAAGAATVGTGVTLLLLDDGDERGTPSGVALSLRGRLP